ncbi:hypothetical protein BGZ63DRAFT_360626 [Mariannaea sp. PMI_226]|nr:hypothetical protein BGZ63DRAFT_360626 [Mariannaea sp. PMI_226]
MDPLSITTGVIGAGTFAFNACTALHSFIRELKSQDKSARALKAELNDLTVVLQLLLETIANHPTLDFQALKLLLLRCGHACEDYGKIIERCTKHSSTTSRPSVRDWVKQKYLQGDINDFKAMLAAYKSTINIALANANLRIAAISPEVLEDYKDMISDVSSDLSTHMADIQAKIERLQAGDATAIDDVAVEWDAMLEERKCAQSGLDMCAQLSAEIARFESASTEPTKFSDRPSAQKHIKSGLGEIKGSVASLVTRLRTHEAAISSQLEAMSQNDVFSEPVATQLAQLRQTKESISQCIDIVTEAGELVDERSNVFEDITLADNSYAFSVSTVNDLVTARRLNLKGRSRHFGGQVADETVQQAMKALTQLDAVHLKVIAQNPNAVPQDGPDSDPRLSGDTKQFNNRFGPGVPLSANRTGEN